MGGDAVLRRNVAALLMASLGLAFAVAPTTTHGDPDDTPPHRHLGQVDGGDLGALTADLPAVFWESPEFTCDGTSLTQVSAPDRCTGNTLFTWMLEVTAGADQLWVDVDDPYRQDAVTLRVTGPASEQASASTGGDLSNGVRFSQPTAGTWTVELAPQRTDGTRVRLRAGLVGDERPQGELLPNLQVLPPYEFGFAAPVNPTNSVFLASDDLNPGMGTHSCTPDEVQEAADPTQTDEPRPLLRCLRFTTGPQNTGAGHFDLRFPILDRAQHDRDRLVEMTQVIHHSNPTISTERPAGTYEYHATHGHYHYADVLHYEALEVTDEAAGELRSAGVGTKSGFCPDDQGYGRWSTFDQDEQFSVHAEQDGDCLALTGRGAMGMTAGWGDVYRWQRPGQYVDFTGIGDGTYVIRATVDIHDNVLETDETDNASYALIEVTGDEVEVLERGYGDSPFDPDKRLASDHRH